MQAIRTLSDAGVPVGVLVAPVIPQLNDKDMEAILEAAAAHGARTAGWIMLRLPLEVAPLFRAWLDEHYPLRAAHVMSLINQLRGGRDNVPQFGTRMRGSGTFAELIEKRFELAVRRLGLNEHAARRSIRRSFARPGATKRRASCSIQMISRSPSASPRATPAPCTTCCA